MIDIGVDDILILISVLSLKPPGTCWGSNIVSGAPFSHAQMFDWIRFRHERLHENVLFLIPGDKLQTPRR